MAGSRAFHSSVSLLNKPSLFLRLARACLVLQRVPFARRLCTRLRRLMVMLTPSVRLTTRLMPISAVVPKEESIVVLSANLWHDWPRYRRLSERLESFARLVEAERADVILLQEVARTSELRVDEWLANRLTMAYVYSRANGDEAAIGFEEGLAVFSRFPLTSPRLRQLGSVDPFVRRLALGAKVETPHGQLLAISVHLGLLRRQNAEQQSRLREWVTAVAADGPALIGGDFNAHENTPQIEQTRRGWLDIFRYLHPAADGTTFEWRSPWGHPLLRRRLDYLFLHVGDRPWRVLEARHLDAPGLSHSDHRAVLARLTLDRFRHK